MDEPLFQKINILRKSGNLDEAWNLGCPAVQENSHDQYLKGAFFWVCYAYLKNLQGAINTRSTSRNGDHTPKPDELERINFYLDWILWLKIPQGGYEYRSLLLVFQKNLESIPKLALLLLSVSSNLFNDEDKVPFQNEKGESPSLMLKFARKVAKSWITNEEFRQIPIEDLCVLFERTRIEAKDNQSKLWLDYDEAKCLIFAKRYEQAREFVLKVLRKKQTESWAWAALAATYRVSDSNAAISLFSKALSCADDDVFALPIYASFAPLLASLGFEDEASMCVKRAVNCYVKNGWAIKSNIEAMIKQPWYKEDVDLLLLPGFLRTHSTNALDFLFGEREQCMAIIENVHASGQGFHAYINRNRSVSVRLGLFRSKKAPSPGDYVRLTLAVQDQSVVVAEPCSQEDMVDVESEEGILSVKDKGFGFVNDTYIPRQIVKNEMDGKLVSVLRVMDFDKTKNRYAWKAITIQLKD